MFANFIEENGKIKLSFSQDKKDEINSIKIDIPLSNCNKKFDNIEVTEGNLYDVCLYIGISDFYRSMIEQFEKMDKIEYKELSFESLEIGNLVFTPLRTTILHVLGLSNIGHHGLIVKTGSSLEDIKVQHYIGDDNKKENCIFKVT